LQHLGDNFPASFPNSLARRVNLPVKWATQGAPMQCGIHVAPPGAHLSVDAQKLFVLSRTPKVQFVRPSANILFSSLAVVFRSRFLAVVLTGFGSDAAMGVTLAKSMGGYVIVQDQETSAAVEMPAAAIRTGCADLILPRDNIAHALITLTMMPGAAELFTGVNAYPDSLKN
jgi:two-component system chemotaxis response regulator CheB